MKNHICIQSFMLVLLFNSVCAQTWKPVEVPIGDARFIKTDPHRPGVIYVGYPGVIAGSSDGGESWFYKPYTDIWEDVPSDLLIDAADSTHWYLVLEKAGVARSTDAGETWFKSNTGIDYSGQVTFTSIVQDPERPWILYLVGTRGIQKTTDRGNNWSPRLILSPNHDFKQEYYYIQKLVINKSTPDSLYVFAAFGDIMRWVSGDQGSSWEADSAAQLWIMSHATLGSGNTILYGRRISRDYGASWESFDSMESEYSSTNNYYMGSIDVPGLKMYVLCNRWGIFTRNYEDTLWRATELYWGNEDNPHTNLNYNALACVSATNTIFGVKDNQLWKSTDGCRSFEYIETGPFLPQAWSFSTPSATGNIIATLPIISMDNGTTWIRSGYLPVHADVYNFNTIAISPHDSTFVLFGHPMVVARIVDPDRWFDGGPRNISGLGYNLKLHFNPHNPHEIFGGDYGLWRTTDSVLLHAQPPQLGDPLPDYSIAPKVEGNPGWYSCMAFHPHLDGIYYYCWWETIPNRGYLATLWKTRDFGESWTPLLDWFSSYYSDIAINPEHPDIIVIASNDGILRSGDGGASWTQHDGAPFISTYLTGVLIDPRRPNVYYASARTSEKIHPKTRLRGGLYVSYDYAQTWELLPMDGMYTTSIQCMHYHENPRRLYAGTRAGIYEMLLPEETTEVTNPEPTESLMVHVYPNPARTGSTVHIDLQAAKGRYSTVELFSLQGRRLELLHMGASTGTPLRHSVGDLQPGVYYYRITTDGKQKTVPLIIIR